MKKVFCIGELLIDFVAENQGKDLSKAKEFSKKAGGAPANVSCAISKLGGESLFIGCVGDDPFGTFLLRILENEKVDISSAQKSDTFTTLAFVSIDADGERDFVFSRGADKELTYDSSLKSRFENNILHFGAATALLGGSLEETYNRYLFDGITKNAFISFDPNYRVDLWKNKEDVFIRKCHPYIEKSHLCKFSLEEAQLLSGKDNLDEACQVFHEMGTQIIVITLGSEGTLLSTAKFSKTIPSIKVNPKDTTGAGDAFIGCLLQQISQHSKFENVLADEKLLTNMVARANKAGAITTENFGAIESLPTLQQLDS
ncbi:MULTISPECIES: carbohydrate kinase family protein [Maribacter]|uniref:Fructokinase n=1 Tax=Maribacter stanieri TaxID=440514 RepID=A0A1I6HMR6_9FLAO|nr:MULTISPECIES: carbohydrate kinase [Maribacter]SFR55688.1 fructokinase [Maribacter stanieri]|tara:strand:+ start:4628 stop:5572 length:945 start_codon:yes stop_codon:yes gene_type:complete